MLRLLTVIVCGLLLAEIAGATGVYMEPETFVSGAFDGDPPAPDRLWVKDELQTRSRAILGHDLGRLRIVYWGRPGRTAWVLEEIGKEQLITVGIVVTDHGIESLEVLVFRESRGWEVRYPFFTDQFHGLNLADDDRLDRPIDGISGATLSVSALSRLARLALMLHGQTHFAGTTGETAP